MNLKILSQAEDLHSKLIDIDGQIAKSHKVLRDLSENDGQKIEMHYAPEQASPPNVKGFASGGSEGQDGISRLLEAVNNK